MLSSSYYLDLTEQVNCLPESKGWYWSVPAKTFFLGEYAALAGKAAILLTTKPCFEFYFTEDENNLPYPIEVFSSIHPHSPAGRFIAHYLPNYSQHFYWYDPYSSRGGLGASTAQFSAAYQAYCSFKHLKPDPAQGMAMYFEYAWDGKGYKPSGYDLLAQLYQQTLLISDETRQLTICPWPFEELCFILLHTGQKLATHEYLQQLTTPPKCINVLGNIAADGLKAYQLADEEGLVTSVNTYQQTLKEYHLTTAHSLALQDKLSKLLPQALAVKGCGAMGSDIILILVRKKHFEQTTLALKQNDCHIISSSDFLF